MSKKRTVDAISTGPLDNDQEQKQIGTRVHYRVIQNMANSRVKNFISPYPHDLLDWDAYPLTFEVPLLNVDKQYTENMDVNPTDKQYVCDSDSYCFNDSSYCFRGETPFNADPGPMVCSIIKQEGRHIARHVWTKTVNINDIYDAVNQHTGMIKPKKVIAAIHRHYTRVHGGDWKMNTDPGSVENAKMIETMKRDPANLVFLFWSVDAVLFQGRISESLRKLNQKLFFAYSTVNHPDGATFADTAEYTCDNQSIKCQVITFYLPIIAQFKQYYAYDESELENPDISEADSRYEGQYFTRLEFIIETLIHELIHVIQNINGIREKGKKGNGHGRFFDKLFKSLFGFRFTNQGTHSQEGASIVNNQKIGWQQRPFISSEQMNKLSYAKLQNLVNIKKRRT
eukprot:TRINITY_DN2336_c0_g1_i3.p1 TRINITY_DN2336_c0_g1~~TRINITY_DN2336_c0_g1_i3.p1  ORF type:complete len:398 (-),score=-50.07 TRINITY_DN2336_c0_g1_i3:114-1307(-)